MNETIRQIELIIQTYQSKYKVLTIDQLMDAKSRLVSLLSGLAEHVAYYKKDSLIATVYRKYEHHKMKSQLIDEGLTVSLAESKSIEKAKDKMEAETTAEHLSYLYKLKLSQYNRVVDDITQRISILRDDLNYSRATVN